MSGDLVRVVVDQDLCIGGGLLPRDRADVVVVRCPSRAIAISDAQGQRP